MPSRVRLAASRSKARASRCFSLYICRRSTYMPRPPTCERSLCVCVGVYVRIHVASLSRMLWWLKMGIFVFVLLGSWGACEPHKVDVNFYVAPLYVETMTPTFCTVDTTCCKRMREKKSIEREEPLSHELLRAMPSESLAGARPVSGTVLYAERWCLLGKKNWSFEVLKGS